MTLALILAVVGAVTWYQRRRAGRAGASAARRARQLRTPLVRLAELVGVRTAAGSLARRSDIGAAGERATARLLNPLRMQGWTVLHDRALPTGNANVDHLLVSRGRGRVRASTARSGPRGTALRVVGGRLLHGTRDVTDRLDGLRHEAATVAQVLDCPVVLVVAMHGAPVEYGELLFDGIRIVPAGRVAAVLRTVGRRRAAAGRTPPGGRRPLPAVRKELTRGPPPANAAPAPQRRCAAQGDDEPDDAQSPHRARSGPGSPGAARTRRCRDGRLVERAERRRRRAPGEARRRAVRAPEPARGPLPADRAARRVLVPDCETQLPVPTTTTSWTTTTARRGRRAGGRTRSRPRSAAVERARRPAKRATPAQVPQQRHEGREEVPARRLARDAPRHPPRSLQRHRAVHRVLRGRPAVLHPRDRVPGPHVRVVDQLLRRHLVRRRRRHLGDRPPHPATGCRPSPSSDGSPSSRWSSASCCTATRSDLPSPKNGKRP